MASRERAFTVTNGAVSYGAIVSSYGYQYDECNHLSKLTCSVLGSSWSTVYTYDSDNRPSTTTMSSGKVITNTYDAIGRLSNRAIGLSSTYNTALTYVPGNSSSKTTGLVSTYRNGSDDAYSYAYDENGNITSITQGSTGITYGYDDANRLIRENNGVLNQTITYTYDQFGNIKSKTVYAYTTVDTDQLPNLTPTDTITYTYNAPNGWNDQLSQFGDETITYDSMGNPTTYRGYNMTWRGKQLAGISGGTKNVSFEYNEDGLRQKKTYNGVETNYYYNGSVLIGMQRGQTKYLFSYDASGNVVSVRQGDAEYYYLRNAQGDIVEIIDSTGAVKVQYTYDTWGKKVTTTGTLAGTLGLFQPFRYRGYVYDWETGLYYLQSRYYDPEVGRFISSDVLLSTGQGVLGHNAYAYCLDNPVRYKDSLGKKAESTYPPEDAESNNSDNTIEVDCIVIDDNIAFVLSVPIYGKPFSVVDRGNGQWRSYDKDGRAAIDYDRPHGGHNYWHKHKWNWDGDKPKREKPERDDTLSLFNRREQSQTSRNSAWGYSVIGILLLIILVLDDATGVGVADDEFIPGAVGLLLF